MLDPVSSSALSGLYSASRRFEATANETSLQNRGTAGPTSGSPPAGGPPPTGATPGGPPPNEPPPVEETSSTSRDTATALRNTTPSYLSVLDPSSDTAGSDDTSVVIQVPVPTAEETEQAAIAAEAADDEAEADATERSLADQRAIQANSELVRRLYDLG